MEGYTRLISSNNIVEFDQIKFALAQKGIKVHTEGEHSLTAGNVELTGIDGAWIMVEEDRLEDAQQVLIEMGLDSADKEKSNYNTFVVYTVIVLLIVLLIVLSYAIFVE